MKTAIVTALKLLLVCGLIYWLVAYDKLDFKQLKLFVDHPETFLYNAVLYVVFYLLLGSFRWFVLLRGAGLEVAYPRTIWLQMIGFFFNTAMPGAVGGDIVKAVYVIREQSASRKTPAMLTVLLDRVVGLVALFVMAGIAMVCDWEFMSSHPPMRPLGMLIAAGLVAVFVGMGIVFYPFKEGRDPILKFLSLRLPGFAILKSIYEATRSYRDKPVWLLGTVIISITIQLGSLAYALYVTEQLTGLRPDMMTFATVYPLGVLATAVPLAPGGLGVGHIAFDRLFHLAGWSGGANVFNVIVMGQLAMNLLGFIPYLLHKRKLPVGEDMTRLADHGAP